MRHDFTMSHIPIVMLTARHSPDDRVKAMEFGADGYITKPFSIELLLARIDNLLTQRRKLFEKFSSQSARNKVVELAVEDVVVTDRDEEFMKNVMAWLGENVENSELTIDQLASHLGLGRTTMYNKLKSLTGKSPVELIKEYRITKSKLLLRTGQFSVSEVAYKVGFSDPGYFSRCFREQFHMSPAEYCLLFLGKYKEKIVIPGTEGHPDYGFGNWMKHRAIMEHFVVAPFLIIPFVAAIQALIVAFFGR